MPIILPTSNHWSKDVPLLKKNKVLRGRLIGPVFARQFYKNIQQLLAPMSQELADMLPWLVNAAGAEQAAYTLTAFQESWRRKLSSSIPGIVYKWRTALNEQDREKLERSLAKAFHVNTAYILDDDIVGPQIEALTAKAVDLITSIPDDYLNDVKRAVLDQYANIPHPGNRSLAEEIRHIAGVSETKAKMIARDQTAKMTSSVQQARQTSLGIEGYIWRNSKDRRVVGNPSGLYPKGNSKHGNHWSREGQFFRWDEPPHDGHPGWPILCRCYAEPVVDSNTIDLR